MGREFRSRQSASSSEDLMGDERNADQTDHDLTRDLRSPGANTRRMGNRTQTNFVGNLTGAEGMDLTVATG